MRATPVEVGDAFRPRLTVDGLRDLIQDLRRAGRPVPIYIIVSEYDRRDLNQDLAAGAVSTSKEAEKPSHDGEAVGIVEGIPIMSRREVGRGKAHLIYPVGTVNP